MNHETLEQAAIRYASEKMETRYPIDAREDFKAGASWREQQDQKNSQLDFVRAEIAGIKLIQSIWINNPCAVFSPQAASLLVKLNSSYQESVKLLAEKDAEIEKAKEIIKYLCKTGIDFHVAEKIKALLGEE